MRSIARFRAVLINQARGLLGALSRGHRSAAIAKASWAGLLGEVKVAEEADQGGQHAAPFLSEDLIECRYQYTSEGRISTAPP